MTGGWGGWEGLVVNPSWKRLTALAAVAVLTAAAGCTPVPLVVPSKGLTQITFVFAVKNYEVPVAGTTVDTVISMTLLDPTLIVTADGRPNPFPLESHRLSPYQQNILLEPGAGVVFDATAHIHADIGFTVECWVENVAGSQFPNSYGSADININVPAAADGLRDVTAQCQYTGGA